MGVADVRGWELWKLPPRLRLTLLAVDALTLAAVAGAVILSGAPDIGLDRFALLAGMAIVYTEGLRRIERLRRRVADTAPHVSMNSVWAFAGAVVLPPELTCALVALISAHTWLRGGRLRHPHRAIFNASIAILASLAATLVIRAVRPSFSSMSHSLPVLLAIVPAILAFFLVETFLIAVVMRLANGPASPASLLGGWDDNALEIATLCLGALAAVALIHQAWLVLIVIPPMVVLQRSALVKHLELAASTDPKTGLLNAVAWQQVASRELSRATRDGLEVAFLIIDMDNFKQVNDEHGHLVGDEALRAVASRLLAELRDYDTVGRFGGEEFVAVLPDVSPHQAVAIAERLRVRIGCIRARKVSAEAEDAQQLSASVGVACYPIHGEELEELLHAADSALYGAKDAGRNRVELADAATPERRSLVDMDSEHEQESA